MIGRNRRHSAPWGTYAPSASSTPASCTNALTAGGTTVAFLTTVTDSDQPPCGKGWVFGSLGSQSISSIA
ncbi:hypothetical protein ACFOHS_16395 [Jhaorihella thermophila]